ncbi:MAG: hypothetical protein RMJ28_01595 [Nitrososphaerota archaeon]|nr:hypothetical protein [Candidatus Calditenuaceae archaeon]MDW8072918.1 hypothetical protein [Nitrososphaerota archaeon]
MEKVEEVLKMVEELEEGLKTVEEKIAKARSDMQKQVDQYIEEIRVLYAKIMEEEKRAVLEEAEKSAQEEAARIRGEYLRRAEEVRMRFSSRLNELAEYLLKTLLPEG